MNFKQLNEEFKQIIKTNEDKQTLGFSGNKQNIQDIISKLNREYGDLTIPEFIDLMMKKGEKGEDILDESLNESRSYLASTCSFILELKRYPFKNLYFEFYDNKSCLSINNKSTSKCFIYLEFLEKESRRESNNSIEYVITGEIIGEIDDKDRKLLSKVPYKTGFGRRPYVILDLSSGVYSKQMSPKEINIDLAKNFIEILKEIDNEINEENNSLDLQGKQLQQIKQRIKNTNTTIKQALSKASIVKKIQALQNPTPEQLARILAAIDVQESFKEERQGIIFDSKDEEFLLELMRKFGPETPLKKVLEQIKTNNTK